MINKIKAEIERRIKVYEHRIDNNNEVEDPDSVDIEQLMKWNAKRELQICHQDGKAEALKDLLSFIESLEKEQETGYVKAPCAICCYDKGCDTCEHYQKRLKKEQDSNLDFQQFAKEMDAIFALPASQTKNTEDEPLNWEYAIAKHFYELGLNAKANVPKIKGWVARYANGDLEVGREKPRYYEDEGKTYITDPSPTIPLDKSWFPELRWLDEPIEVELILRKI